MAASRDHLAAYWNSVGTSELDNLYIIIIIIIIVVWITIALKLKVISIIIRKCWHLFDIVKNYIQDFAEIKMYLRRSEDTVDNHVDVLVLRDVQGLNNWFRLFVWLILIMENLVNQDAQVSLQKSSKIP